MFTAAPAKKKQKTNEVAREFILMLRRQQMERHDGRGEESALDADQIHPNSFFRRSSEKQTTFQRWRSYRVNTSGLNFLSLKINYKEENLYRDEKEN